MSVLVSGTRPTGQLHIGHYFGILSNWQRLQDSGDYDCYYFVADWHSLTTRYAHSDDLVRHVLEVTKDLLASGIDPGKSTIYLQSWVPETAELHLLLSMLTPNNWPERDPTLKDLVRSTDGTLTYGMLGYPVLQTADILTFRGAVVPVGKDQEAHLEMSRQIARRFNHLYGRELFPEPQAVLTETPSVKGIDSQKMSKSLDNDIKLAATPEETQARVKRMITDRERVRRQDPGSTERCEVPFPYYGLFADEQAVATTKHECETAQRGCMDCKKILSGIINEHLAEFRDRRASIDEDTVWDVLREGSARARPVAAETLEQARSAMGVCRARK